MPSKNSINRPKNKNTARAKAQHKSAVARRRPQTAILHGKVDSKKVQQKKLRRTRLSSALIGAGDDKDEVRDGDVEMVEEEGSGDDDDDNNGDGKIDKLDTRAKKEARKAAIREERERKGTVTADDPAVEKEFGAAGSTGRGTTLGGPPAK